MKKYIAALLLAAGTLALTGCAGSHQKLEAQYEEEGIALMDAGDYAGAVEKFDAALNEATGKLSELDLDVCYYKALAEYKSGDTDEAIEIYRDLTEYDQKNYMPFYMLGTIYCDLGETEQAQQMYQSAVALKGSDNELVKDIYLNLSAAGDEENALVYVQNALADDDAKKEDALYQGYFNYLLGNTQTAKALLEEAHENGQDEALFYLANIAMDEEEYETALEYIEQGLALEDQTHLQEFQYARIAVYEFMGDFTSAKTYCEQYVADYPDDEAAAREYTFLQTR